MALRGNFALLAGVTLSIYGGQLFAGSILSGTDNAVHLYSDAVVAGGKENEATGENCVVSGGYLNKADFIYSTVGGGVGNIVNIAQRSTIGGGDGNRIYKSGFSFIGGGHGNSIDSHLSNNTISGGRSNISKGYGTTIGGGIGNWVQGNYSTIPGGYGNHAWGNASLAFGVKTWIYGNGTVAFSDDTDLLKIIPDEKTFVGIFGNGYKLFTNSTFTQSVILRHGDGAWNMSVHPDKVENIESIDGDTILQTLSALEIQKWNYVEQNSSIKHIAPTAESFNQAFGLNGNDSEVINSLDADGIALKAIQALYQKVLTLESENASLRTRVEALEGSL